MNIVIIGRSGQLAFELSRELKNSDHQVTLLGRDDIDITNSDIIEASLAPLSPDVLINASAYTAVDKAEEDTEACNAINAIGASNHTTCPLIIGPPKLFPESLGSLSPKIQANINEIMEMKINNAINVLFSIFFCKL